MFKKFLAAGAVAAAVGVMAYPVEAQGRPTIVSRATDINESTGEFDTLISLVTTLGLADALSGKDQLTVFAPTDQAFAALAAMPGYSNLDSAELKQIVLYHVTAGRISADRLSGKVGGEITMLSGQTAAVTAGPDVDGANVVIPDVSASNGFIHAIDAVLLPPNIDALLAD
jgi:transforming growth factor-beta-induced protein